MSKTTMGLRFWFVIITCILSIGFVFGDSERVLLSEEISKEDRFSVVLTKSTFLQPLSRSTDNTQNVSEVDRIIEQHSLISQNRKIMHVTEKEYELLLKDSRYTVRPVKMYYPHMIDVNPLVQSDLVWNINISSTTITGNAQSVCVIDTGIRSDHLYLQDNIIAEKCFCHPASSNRGTRTACCPNNEIEDNFADDDDGHGTHVSGIIAATNGFYGVAHSANIVAVRAGDYIGFTDVDLQDSIDWCVANKDIYNISVISMSLGGGFYSQECPQDEINDNIQNAINKNISVVISTGNDNNHTHIGSPACVPNVIRVTSSTKEDELSSFSNRNNLVNLIAPGTSITSTSHLSSSSFITYSGTSMATPVVSGAILLLNQILSLQNQHKTPQQLLEILNQTGTPIFDSASNRNYSRINIFDAIQTLLLDLEANITLNQNQTHIQVNITATGSDFYNYTFLFQNESEFEILNQNQTPITNQEILLINRSDLFEGQTLHFKLNVFAESGFMISANKTYDHPFITPPPISNLNSTIITNSSILINWTNPDSELFNYSLIFLNNTNIINTSDESYTLTNLQANTFYNITILTARNESILNTQPISILAQTLPNPIPNTISNLNATERTTTTITWNWTNPTEHFHKTILYLNDENIINLTYTQHNYTAEDLIPNTQYTITIFTANAFGDRNNTPITNITQTTIPDEPVFSAITRSHMITQPFKPITINVTLLDTYPITNVTVNNQLLQNISPLHWSGVVPAQNNFTIVATNIGGAQNTTIIEHTLDSIAPNTTINLTRDDTVINTSLWQNDSVLVTLNATDNTEVALTQYRFGNQPWQTYTQPFTITQRISQDRISFRSIDVAGNVESTKSITVLVDTSDPVINLAESSQLVTGVNGTISLQFEVTNSSTQIMNHILEVENATSIIMKNTTKNNIFYASYSFTPQQIIGTQNFTFSITTIANKTKTFEGNFSIQNTTPGMHSSYANNSYVPNTNTEHIFDFFNMNVNESKYYFNDTTFNITQSQITLNETIKNISFFLVGESINKTFNYTFIIDDTPPHIFINHIDSNLTGTIIINGTMYDEQTEKNTTVNEFFINNHSDFNILSYNTQNFEFEIEINTLQYESGTYNFTLTAVDKQLNINQTNFTLHINHSKPTTVPTQNTVAFFDETLLRNSLDKITSISSQNVSATIQPLKKLQKNITNQPLLEELFVFKINATTFANATIYAYTDLTINENTSIFYDEFQNQSFTKVIPITIIQTQDGISYFSFQTNSFSEFLLATQLPPPPQEQSDDTQDSGDDGSSNGGAGTAGVASVFDYNPITPNENTTQQNPQLENESQSTPEQNQTQQTQTQSNEETTQEPITETPIIVSLLPYIGILLLIILLVGGLILFIAKKKKQKRFTASSNLADLKKLEDKVHLEVEKLRKSK